MADSMLDEATLLNFRYLLKEHGLDNLLGYATWLYREKSYTELAEKVRMAQGI